MGKELVDLYKNKVKRSWKIAFYSTFIIGLFVHIYKFTNTLLNHDSIYNYYSTQNVIGSGRWFLSIACGISSYFDLPWVNGLLSLIFIALTTVVIVDIFKMKNPALIVLTGGLLVTFPAVTETLYFGFTCDGYMLAMLFAALAVRFSTINDKKISHIILSILFVCLTCAIYQAYVSFALILAICYFITILLRGNHKTKEHLMWIAKQAVIYIGGLAAYYIIWKLCMHFQGVQATSYQGINSMGLSFATITSAFGESIKSCLNFFFEWDIINKRISLYTVLNILFLAAALIAIIVAVLKSKLYKRPIELIILFLCIIVIPFAACIWLFTSSDVLYCARMLQSLSVIYILGIVLFDEYFPHKLSNLSGLLALVIVFNFGIQANIGYYFLDKNNKATYAIGTEMVSRIHMMDTEADTIAVIGKNLNSESSAHKLRDEKTHIVGATILPHIMFDNNHVSRYLNNTFNMDLKIAEPDKIKEFEQMPEVEEMGCWPASDSIQVIDDTIVIKLS